jgi:RNA polymerase sigma-70 factor, ECF subfamily
VNSFAGTLDGSEALATVVGSAIAGDATAFASIVRTYHGDMARVAYVVAGDVEIAEEAVQSAWSIAWRRLRSLRDPDRLRPWLVAIAANEARQILRRRNRYSVVEIDVAEVSDVGGDPADAVERLDLADRLRHLQPDDRVLLALRYVAGLDSNEIAAQIGLSPSGTRGRLSRLLGRLRTELHDA